MATYNHYFDMNGSLPAAVFPATEDAPVYPYLFSVPANPDTSPPPHTLRGDAPLDTGPEGRWPGMQNGAVVYFQSHKGEAGWLNGEPYTITDFGPPPDGWSATPAPPALEEARAAKLAAIDAETSAAILAGFEYTVDGRTLHFSYDANDQQNFADSANASLLSKMGVPNVPESVTWNGWEEAKDEAGAVVSRSLVRLVLTPDTFLALYTGGALAHKAARMETGGQRKAAAEAATTLEELQAV
ncbi:hypothetical protein KL86DPRO_11494 [uncultured delta proteobacterium]|uniref:DUF4376 domain-containing protein n=1 Tax=uncultured delta proteobacterium TaxID=34034 RepID=A0A212JHW1_9DELT|nr:hypothetical protein KL86DPRO_11494 [uncultured delta proteobacterium]